MGRRVINLARQPSPPVAEVVELAINGSHNEGSDTFAHYSVVDGRTLPHLNLFPHDSSRITENSELRRPLLIVVGGVWEHDKQIDSDRKFVEKYTKRMFASLFTNHNSFNPTPDVIDANQIEPGNDSRFPTIKSKMKQGKYNSIIIFNASSEEHPRALSEYPLCKSGQHKLYHLLDELYGTGVSSDDTGTMLVAFIDNALTMISDRRLRKLVRENQQTYPMVNLIFPFAEKDDRNFEYEYGALALFLKNYTSGMGDVESFHAAQSKMAERTTKYYRASEDMAAIRNSTFLYFQTTKIRNVLPADGLYVSKIDSAYPAFPVINELVASNPNGLSVENCGKIRKQIINVLFTGFEFLNRASSQESFEFHAELFSIAVAVAQYSHKISVPIGERKLKELFKEYMAQPNPFTKKLFRGNTAESSIFRHLWTVRSGEHSNEYARLSREYLRILSPEARPDKPFAKFEQWLAKLETVRNHEEVSEQFRHVEGLTAHSALILDTEFSHWFAGMCHVFHKAHTQDIDQPENVKVEPDLWYDRETPYMMLPETVFRELEPLEKVRRRWCRTWTDEEPPFQNIRSIDMKRHAPWTRSLISTLNRMNKEVGQ